MILRKAYKFRLKTKSSHEEIFRRFSGHCRFVWNKALSLQLGRLESGIPLLSYQDLARLLTLWRQSEEYGFLKEAPAQVLQQALIALEVMPDHLHLFVSVDPDVAPNQVAHRLKGYTSHVLRREFPHLIRLPALWTRSYFVSTAGMVSSKTIEQYITAQKNEGLNGCPSQGLPLPHGTHPSPS